MVDISSHSFVRRGNAFMPADVHADEYLREVKDGAEVVLSYHRPLNPAQHRWFHAMLHKAMDNIEGETDYEGFRDKLMHVIGHVRHYMTLDGQMRTVARSMSPGSMTQGAYKRMIARVLWALQFHCGIDGEALMREVDAIEGTNYTDQFKRSETQTNDAGNRTASSAGAATGDAAEHSSATESPPAPSLNSEAAPVAAPDTAAGKEPKAIPPKEPKPAAGLSSKDKTLLRKYAAGLADANLPRPLARGSSAFLSDYGITEGTPAYAAAEAIYQAHLARVNGTGSPAEADEVMQRVLA
jgi:hypothetical protein